MTLPSLVIGIFTRESIARRSLERRDALVISTVTPWCAWRGHVFRLIAPERILLVMLFAEPGRVVTQKQLLETCFGDRPDGGPEWAVSEVRRARQSVKFVCAMIDAKLVRQSGGLANEE